MQSIKMDLNNGGLHKTSYTYDNEWIMVKCTVCPYEVWMNRETHELRTITRGDAKVQHSSGMMWVPMN